jgi:hypothetical protein
MGKLTQTGIKNIFSIYLNIFVKWLADSNSISGTLGITYKQVPLFS